MTKEPQEKKCRLEFTVKFVESVKATDKEQRFTDTKTPGLTLAVRGLHAAEFALPGIIRGIADAYSRRTSLAVRPASTSFRILFWSAWMK